MKNLQKHKVKLSVLIILNSVIGGVKLTTGIAQGDLLDILLGVIFIIVAIIFLSRLLKVVTT